MTRKTSAKSKRRTAIPIAPPAPKQREILSPMEAWYVECLRRLAAHLKRPPSMPEMSAYCKRAVNPVYTSLLRAEAKGHVRRVIREGKRRFVACEAQT